jgi:hypothetical protein
MSFAIAINDKLHTTKHQNNTQVKGGRRHSVLAVSYDHQGVVAFAFLKLQTSNPVLSIRVDFVSPELMSVTPLPV